MDPAIIPGILLMILLIFGTSGKPPVGSASSPSVALESFDDHPTLDVESVNPLDDSDYRVIYSFITQKYTRIPSGDAELIARNLVSYGKEIKVDPKLGAALMARESAFNKVAISSTGAKGLGQIKDFNFKSLNIENPYDIQQNTRGTLSYIKYQLNQWKTESKKTSLALASYFKGYSAVSKTNKMVDSTTKNYVKDIIVNYDRLNQMKAVAMVASSNPLYSDVIR